MLYFIFIYFKKLLRKKIRDVISVLFRGGNALTDFLGGAKYEKNIILYAKTQKNNYLSNSGGRMPPPQMTFLKKMFYYNFS